EADGAGRFAFSGASRTTNDPAPPGGSVRVAAGWQHLARICGDPAVGLERNVRLRLFAVAAGSVSPALDAADLDDPRWPAVLADCAVYVGATPGLKGLHLVARGLDAAQVKARVMQRLLAVARGEPAVPL
ncbi:MAG: hypothetical protein JWO31_3758, partial [Phycisphaerales bacterium]|nr:hypothetical protein [Phycisphaerales bacterium]